MCGITGFWNIGNNTPFDYQSVISAMQAAIITRGPDSEGSHIDQSNALALGHRRLAVVELSEQGKQPMTSFSGRYFIVFNGEVYNHLDIRKELQEEGVSFEGHSDTRTLIEAIAHWGVEVTLNKLIGMFAFALWDKQDKKLILARDRVGIKPLYWSYQNNCFFFASQSKCFRKHPLWSNRLDKESLASFIRLAYIPTNQSIYQDVQQLEPGHYLSIDNTGTIKKQCYWSLAARFEAFEGTRQESVERFESLLEDAVSKRMLSDVPIGAFLSGGVDSSAVAALMQKNSSSAVKTFSVGFTEAAYDESAYAAEVAKHLGTQHTELTVSSDDARNLVPDLPSFYDEPFADSSQLPTLLISKLTREHVTVALSGDGGDEICAGYNRYFLLNKLHYVYNYCPKLIRQATCSLIRGIRTEHWDKLLNIPLVQNKGITGGKLHKLAHILSHESKAQIYPHLITQWQDSKLPLAAYQGSDVLEEYVAKNISTISDMQKADMTGYLPGDILTKVDRASMAFSLEARVPLLDHRVVELAFSLPTEFHLHKGQTKSILREVLYKHVPRKLIERPKMGFGAPIGEWLKGDLREWAGDLLSSERLRREGVFNPEAIETKWKEHSSGKQNWQYALWNILMFQAWSEHYE